jgi:hypothetical protein
MGKIKTWLIGLVAIGGMFVLTLLVVISIFRKRSFPANISQIRNEPGKLIIHSAMYGTGPLNDVSVIDRLNALNRDGLVVLANNNLVSIDPAPGRPKRLLVKYSYGNSEIFTASKQSMGD